MDERLHLGTHMNVCMYVCLKVIHSGFPYIPLIQLYNTLYKKTTYGRELLINLKHCSLTFLTKVVKKNPKIL